MDEKEHLFESSELALNPAIVMPQKEALRCLCEEMMNSNLNRNDAAVIIRISKISKIRNLSGPRNRSAPKIYYYFKECDNFESVLLFI
jgi:hypothetical protein